MVQPIRTAVLPVAGLGTRVLPATKALPKEMLPVFDRPALAYVAAEAFAAGIEHLIMVTGRNKGAIEDYFDKAYELEETLRAKGKTAQLQELAATQPPAGAVSFVRQQEPKGLGHAVWCARRLVGDAPFAVMLPDMLMMARPGCLAQMIAAYGETGGSYIAVEPTDDPASYGIIAPGAREGRRIVMTGMVEKPKREEAPSNLAISGRYLLQPSIFQALERQSPGAGGEIQLTDAIAQETKKKGGVFGLRFRGQRYDCGSKIGFLQATVAFGLSRPEFSEEFADFLHEMTAMQKAAQ